MPGPSRLRRISRWTIPLGFAAYCGYVIVDRAAFHEARKEELAMEAADARALGLGRKKVDEKQGE